MRKVIEKHVTALGTITEANVTGFVPPHIPAVIGSNKKFSGIE